MKIRIRRHEATFQPESARVIIRPFIPSKPQIIANILNRALTLSEAEADAQLQGILVEFASRHFDIESVACTHLGWLQHHARGTQSTCRRSTSAPRLALGAFTRSYATR